MLPKLPTTIATPTRPLDDIALVHCTMTLRAPMVTQLDGLAHALGPLLGLEVSWAAMIRAALAFWLPMAERLTPEIVAAVASERRQLRSGSFCRAYGLREAMVVRLDRLALALGPLVGFAVVRPALSRAALAFWLPVAELMTPEVVATVAAEHLSARSTPAFHPGDMMLLQRDHHPATTGKLHRCSLDLPHGMLERVDALARQAEPALHGEVSRAAILRAAVLPWLARIEPLPAQTWSQEIHRAFPSFGTLLHRSKISWPHQITVRLDLLWKGLDPPFFHTAREGRSALALTALALFLDDAEPQPSAVFEAIRASVVKRGRKAAR